VGLLAWVIKNPIGRFLARCFVVRWLVRKLTARTVRRSIERELKDLVGRDLAEDPVGKAVGKWLRRSPVRRGLDRVVEDVTDRALRALVS
jgi:isocitrate/isopropylmalate dehydrogenase